MKFQAERMEGQNAIARHGVEGVVVNGASYTASVIVPWRGEVAPWDADGFEALTVRHFQRLADLAPELVILGTGKRLRFPPAALLKPLIARGIGVETMDTGAACRTYNVLLGEGRSVVAGLLFDA